MNKKKFLINTVISHFGTEYRFCKRFGLEKGTVHKSLRKTVLSYNWIHILCKTAELYNLIPPRQVDSIKYDLLEEKMLYDFRARFKNNKFMDELK